MASHSTHTMASLLKVGSTSRSALACCSTTRSFSASASSAARRKARNKDDPLQLKNMGKFKHDDVPTLGHMILQQRRETLKLYRTMEFEIPKLAAFRQEYVPPTKEQRILQFRFQHYQGEDHPGARKVTLKVDVARLFRSNLLKTPEAKHKFLLLAGPRFQAANVADVAQRRFDVEKEADVTLPRESQKTPGSLEPLRGEVVISCEKMPADRQNMKWCSDTFDAMVREANQPSPELESLPIDTRPTMARDAKKASFLRRHKPTVNNFPQHWL